MLKDKVQNIIPAPVLLNPLKHHLLFIKQFIAGGLSVDNDDMLKSSLLSIGNSQMDLYTGTLSEATIAHEVIIYLQQHNLLTKEAYRGFVNNYFKIVKLSDNTDWVMRWGEVDERYVHIHPGRYALNTLRVRATALKTAIASVIYMQRTERMITDISLINKVRTELLSLPPSKKLYENEGVDKLIKLLMD